MIEGIGVTIREASQQDASAIVALSEATRDELGAISQHRQWLIQQIDLGEIFLGY